MYNSYSYDGISPAISIISAIISLAISIAVLAAMWKILNKAGEPGWKILIPVYNLYIMYKIAWKTSMFWIMMGITVFSFIMTLVGVAFLTYICAIAAMVIGIIYIVKLAKAYGKDGGFAVGLILLSPIFMMILGFGSAKYIGAQE